MAPPVGNQFWKMRSKHGREKIFKEPKIMLAAAYEYFDWNQRNSNWAHNEAVKSGNTVGTIIQVPTTTPLTIEGLASFLHVNKRYFDDFERRLQPIPEEDKFTENDFSAVITHIREVIYRQKFEGAAVGVFKETIISREMGLTDKIEAKNTNLNYNADVIVTDEEAAKIKKALESKI